MVHHQFGEKGEGYSISAIFIFIKSLANLQATSNYILSCGKKFREESS
jgi:hypothetical protein